MILLVTTVFVLVIACANVANLTLDAAGAARARDGDPRRARRARRAAAPPAAGREPGAVGASAALLGLGLAVAGLDLLTSYTSRFTNRTGEIALDGWVLALHAGRLDRAGAAVRVGAAPRRS